MARDVQLGDAKRQRKTTLVSFSRSYSTLTPSRGQQSHLAPESANLLFWHARRRNYNDITLVSFSRSPPLPSSDRVDKLFLLTSIHTLRQDVPTSCSGAAVRNHCTSTPTPPPVPFSLFHLFSGKRNQHVFAFGSQQPKLWMRSRSSSGLFRIDTFPSATLFKNTTRVNQLYLLFQTTHTPSQFTLANCLNVTFIMCGQMITNKS